MTEFNHDRYLQGTSIDRSGVSSKTSIDRSCIGIAEKLVAKLNDPGGLKFYERVATQYSEHDIDQVADLALKYGRNPGAYFNKLIASRPRSI